MSGVRGFEYLKGRIATIEAERDEVWGFFRGALAERDAAYARIEGLEGRLAGAIFNCETLAGQRDDATTTIEAQQQVIQRLRDGYTPDIDVDGTHVWHDVAEDPDGHYYLPMSPSERAVLGGKQ